MTTNTRITQHEKDLNKFPEDVASVYNQGVEAGKSVKVKELLTVLDLKELLTVLDLVDAASTNELLLAAKRALSCLEKPDNLSEDEQGHVVDDLLHAICEVDPDFSYKP